MAMRQPALVFGLILVAALFSACFSYEDGPNFTLKKPVPRLIGVNSWLVKEVVKNGTTDITASYTDDYIDLEAEGKLRTQDANRSLTQPPFTKDTVVALYGSGSWRLLPDPKNTLEFVYAYEYADLYNPSVVYREEHYEQWEILRLTETELWVQNDSIRIKYIPGF